MRLSVSPRCDQCDVLVWSADWRLSSASCSSSVLYSRKVTLSVARSGSPSGLNSVNFCWTRLDDGLERQARPPDEPDPRRRVGLRLDLDQLVDGPVSSRTSHSGLVPCRESVVSKNSSSVSFSVLAADELQDRRVDAGDRDLGDLGALVSVYSVGLNWTGMTAAVPSSGRWPVGRGPR